MALSTRDALIAEILSDLTELLDRVERLPGAFSTAQTALAEHINDLEKGSLDRQKLFTNDLERITERFQDVAVRNVDDFVSVANEALSKFIQRTNEIKETLDALKLKEESKPETALIPEATKREAPGAAPASWHWISATAFCAGTIVGIVLSMLLK